MKLDKYWGKSLRFKLIYVAGLILTGLIWALMPSGQVQAKDDNKIYLVRSGDTLSAIALRFGVTVEALQAVNNINGSKIMAGSRLVIPVGARETVGYRIQPGDNLYRIAKKFGLTTRYLKQTNNLTSSLIYPGQVLFIPIFPKYGGEPREAKTVVANNGSIIALSEKEINLLARLIHAEARGESLLGKIAVGAVVLNRLAHPSFPKSLQEVIYQKNTNVYQFSPVQDGSINLEPDEESLEAAMEAIRGVDPTGGALYFYNPNTATDRWIKTLPTTKPIGNHIFATE